jgi:hypothetical protein
MKKYVLTGIIMCMLATLITAQRNTDRWQGRLISQEQWQLRKNLLRYDRLQRRAQQETGLCPLERRKLQKAKRHSRRQASRFSIRR